MSKIIKIVKYPNCTEKYIKVVSVKNKKMTFTKVIIRERTTPSITIIKL